MTVGKLGEHFEPGQRDLSGAQRSVVIPGCTGSYGVRETLQAPRPVGTHMGEAGVQVDVWPEARAGPRERVGETAPATPGGNACEVESPQQRRRVARVEHRIAGRRQEPRVQDAQSTGPVAAVEVEHRKMPRVVRAHAALGGPVRVLLAHPLGTGPMSARLCVGVSDRMDTERACNVEVERTPPDDLCVPGVPALSVGEGRHRECVLQPVRAPGPVACDGVAKGGEPVVPAEEEVARLREAQGEQVRWRFGHDRSVAFRRPHGVAGGPGRCRGGMGERSSCVPCGIDRSQGFANRRHGGRNFGYHAHRKAEGQRRLELGVAGADVADFAKRIADSAKQIVDCTIR